MAIDRFTKARFEEALPNNVFQSAGLQFGEETYIWEFSTRPIRMVVRSSVDASGLARLSGEDSIRVYLEQKVNNEWRPLGKDKAVWITRVKGWEPRLTKTLKTLRDKVMSIELLPNTGDIIYFNRNTGKPFAKNPVTAQTYNLTKTK